MSPKPRNKNRVAEGGKVFSFTIQGIPCLIEIETYTRVKGTFRHDAPSDMDYHGYSEIEFSVYDRRGYPAAWLQKKLTSDDIERIEGQIVYLNS